MSVATAKQERFHFLDGLRGIAALMVVIHHSLTANVVKAINHFNIPFIGYLVQNLTQSGVELFFVLSGVVLLRPYLRNQRKFETGEYFIRRAKRIYPPYFVALIFAASVIWYINAYPTWYNELGIHVQFNWPETIRELFIVNYYAGNYNLAWWSLGIEVLFYLSVPICVYAFPAREKLTTGRIWMMITVTFVISVLLQLGFTKYFPLLYDYNRVVLNGFQFVCYPVCFLLGIILAAKDLSNKDARIFIITGSILILASLYYFPVIKSGFGLIYAGVITLAFNVHTLRKWLSKPLMIWLGERSYSLFLVHFSVFYLIDNLAAHFTGGRDIYYGLITRGIGIPMAFFVAMLLFHFVERKWARGLITGDMFWPWQVKRLRRAEEQ